MAALIKNQILKHLSKFTKNLSSDKINLSTLKGEGELSNLELNEDILTQLLELPTWLRITKAVCNRVAVKIQWTRLKSQPICLYLDEVIVETETCEQPRQPASPSQQSSGGKYGFVDRVMDGIYVHVNSVMVKLLSHKFQASLQLSRVKVQSMSPTWQVPSDLRSTRIRDGTREEILLFKEIEWQTTRIEATAVGPEQDFLTPLRLIANQAKIRIVVKKRMNDSAIISSRLTLLLDDLLWVLTITQLKAAILYANSLKEVIERSTKQSKNLAAEKLKKQGHMYDGSHQQSHPSGPDRQESSAAKHFTRFDVISTSYHLITSRFDLHLCDDSSPAEEEKRHWKINGGSMQITFYKLSIDFYPFHPAGLSSNTQCGERKAWHRYTDNVGSRNSWVNKLFAEFREEAVKLRKVCESSAMSSSSSAPALSTSQHHVTSPGSLAASPGRRSTLSPSNVSGSHSANTSPVHLSQGQRNSLGSNKAHQMSPSHAGQGQRSTRLLETCFVLKVEDMTVYMVSMPGQKRTGHNKLLCSDKRQLHLPPDMSVIHLELTDYFFPEGLEYPVPHPNLYVLVNPVRLTLDFLTLLWANVFLLTLSQSLDMDFGQESPTQHMDIKVELLMPRVIVQAEEKVEGQPDRPDAVQLQISKLVICNRRTEEKMGREDLRAILDQYRTHQLLEVPGLTGAGMVPGVEETISQLLYHHSTGEDNPYLDKGVKTLLTYTADGLKLSPSDGKLKEFAPANLTLPSHKLCCDSLKRAASMDVWSATADQVWLEFLGVQNLKSRPVPFVEAIPVTVWISFTKNPGRTSISCARHQELRGKIPHQAQNGNWQHGGKNLTQEVVENCHSPYHQRHSQHTLHSTINTTNARHRASTEGVTSHKHRVQDPNGDGNNTATHHEHEREHSSKYYEDEHRTSKLSMSGGGHTSDGSRRSKPRSQSDSPCRGEYSVRPSKAMDNVHSTSRDRDSPRAAKVSADGHGGRHQSHDGRRCHVNGQRRSNDRARTHRELSDREIRGREQHSPLRRDDHDELVQYQLRQESRRRRDSFTREDSRSSSSPPLGQKDMNGRRVDDSWEWRGKEGRRVRHSSSSSSDRREMDGYRSSEGGERRSREVDGRSSTEEQLNMEFSRDSEDWQGRGLERRQIGIHHRGERWRNNAATSGREEEVAYDRESPGGGMKKSRRSSSSSDQMASGVFRGTRGHSCSRERRGSAYDRRVEEGGEKQSCPANRERSVDRSKEELHRRSPQYGGQGCSSERRNNYNEVSNSKEWKQRETRGRFRDRDQMDGLPSSHSGVFQEQPDAGRERRGGGRLHKTQSIDQDSEKFTHRSDRCKEAGSYSHHDYGGSPRQRESSNKWRHTDADCDNDSFSQTSPSSIDTCKDGGQEQRSRGSCPTDGSSRRWGAQEIAGREQAWSQSNSRPPPEGCKSQEEVSPSTESCKGKGEAESKICILPKVSGKLRIQINHFQYLFLLRLSESFSAFQLDLTADLSSVSSMDAAANKAALFKQSEESQLSPSIFLPLLLTDLELAVVCPYQMHQRTFSDDFSIISPFLQGVVTGQDAVFGYDGEGSSFPHLVDPIEGHQTKDDSSLKPIHPSITFKSNSSSQLENLHSIGYSHGENVSARSVRGNTGPTSSPTVGRASHAQGSTPFPLENIRKDMSEHLSQSVYSRDKDSGIGTDRKPPSHRQQRGPGAKTTKGAADVKKVFTSAFSSFTDKLKNKMENMDDGNLAGDDFDTLSIRTDTSDDDFEHMSLDDTEEVPAFFHDPPPPDISSVADSYSEQGEAGDALSMYAESSTTKGKEMVYVVLFKLEHTEIILESQPDQTLARVQVANLASLQLGNICYEDFHARFSTDKGYIQDENEYSLPPPRFPIQVKMVMPAPDQQQGLTSESGQITVCADDLSLQFKMSGITCLSDFVEDEKLPEMVPMSISIRNLLLVLEEDRPPTNVTSPGAVPLNIHIQQMAINRGKDGVIYMSGYQGNSAFDHNNDTIATTTATTTPTPTISRPELTNALTSPIMSPDGTMALLMASQNEAVLLRRQLEEVRRANRLYEQQILQWRDLQDSADGTGGNRMGSMGHGSVRAAMARARNRASISGDTSSGSPSSSTGFPDTSPSSTLRTAADLTSDPAFHELEKENLLLQQKLVRMEDDLLIVSKEKESLLRTLQLLQDELLTSERKQRTKTK